MKYMTSGDIHRMFKQEDEGTIIYECNIDVKLRAFSNLKFTLIFPYKR